MKYSRIALIMIGVLLTAQAATPPCCLGDEVKCTGKYKSHLKPTDDELKEILQKHAEWLKAGGRFNRKLADDPRRANLCGADLSNAPLIGADLNGADLAGAQVSKAKLSYADLTDAIYAPVSEPPDPYVAGIKGLATLKAVSGEEIGLVQLRKLLQDAGLRDGVREVTCSIQRNITRDQLSQFPSPAWLAGILRKVGLEWTTAYGLYSELALLWILLVGVLATPVYMRAMLRPTAESGIIRVFLSDRLDGTVGDPADEEEVKKQLIWAQGSRDVLRTTAYFSLISAVNIGFEQYTPGDWIRRLQRRKYSLEAVGWIRVVAGVQALLSVYLLAMWVLTQFGQPSE